MDCLLKNGVAIKLYHDSNPKLSSSLSQVLQDAIEVNVSTRRQMKIPASFLYYYEDGKKVLEDLANYNFKVCSFIWTKCQNLTGNNFDCVIDQILFLIYLIFDCDIYWKLKECTWYLKTGSRENNHWNASTLAALLL